MDDYAGRGGGIYNSSGGTLTVTNSTLSGNYSATGDYVGGGGIYNSPGGTLTVTNSTLSGNSARWGGGICNGGTLTVTDSTLLGNSASDGGGICNIGGSYYVTATLTVTNSTLSGNSADDGGGISNHDGTLIVTNSTLSGNSADRGGGIYSYGYFSTATLNNTIVADNGTSNGPDIYRNYCTISGSHNLIGRWDGPKQLGRRHRRQHCWHNRFAY